MHRFTAVSLTLVACAASAQESNPDSPALAGAAINYAALHNAEFEGLPESERAWPIYAEIQALLAPHLRALRPVQAAQPGDANWGDAIALLDEIPQLIPLIEQLRARPTLAWPWADAMPAGWVRAQRGPEATVREPSPDPLLTDIVLPYATTIRTAGTLLRLEALRAAEEGDLDRAIEILEHVPTLARHLQETRVTATCVGAIALQGGVLVQGVLQLTNLSGEALSPDHLDRLNALLDTVTHRKFVTDLIADEQSVFADAIDNIYNESDPLGNPQISFAGAGKLMNLSGSTVPPDLDPTTDIPEDKKREAIARFRTMALSYDESIEGWQRAWDTTAEHAAPPVWEWEGRPAFEMLRAESRAAAEDSRTLPHLLFVSGYGRIAEFCELLRVQTDAAYLAVALQRFRNETGAWPTALEELVPRWTPTLPADWVDGQPLRYTQRPAGPPAVYSIGPDGDDDNASPIPAAAGERYVYPAQREFNPGVIPDGDWVLWP